MLKGAVALLLLAGLAGCARKLVAPPMDSQVVLNSLISLTDGHLSSMLGALEAVAATDAARSGQWARIKPLLGTASRRQVDAECFYVVADGSHYYTMTNNRVDTSLKDRPYFAALQAGEPVLGAPVVSRSTTRKVAVVAAPIMDQGRMVGAVGASVYLDNLSVRVRNEMGLGGEIIFFALDETGSAMISWRSSRVFADPTRQGSESLTVVAKQMRSQPRGIARYEFDDGPRTVIFAKSGVTGWSFALGRPDRLK
jgi:hypothetical protein